MYTWLHAWAYWQLKCTSFNHGWIMASKCSFLCFPFGLAWYVHHDMASTTFTTACYLRGKFRMKVNCSPCLKGARTKTIVLKGTYLKI